MQSVDDAREFFVKKRRWSKYKDLILDYYLGPYLAKVATLHKPIAVIDCFAGPGIFEDGEIGSPLIIGRKLAQAQARGAEVVGFFIEKDDELYQRLLTNVNELDVPTQARHGDFREYVDEIQNLARTHSTFVYLDPIGTTHLSFDDLAVVYEKLRDGQSVETLINFLSAGFTRLAQGLSGRLGDSVLFDMDHSETARCNRIAGGEYWQTIILAAGLSERQRIDAIADGYSDQLGRWFPWVLKYPIRDKYEDEKPKYHLIFGSRHPDAVDLMNRAMVTARREFVGSRFIEGMLFPNQPKEELIDEKEIESAVLETSEAIGSTTWKLLRVHTTQRYPCLYTDSEINRSIKKAIKHGSLKSSAKGTRIEQDARVWMGKS